MEAIRSLLHEKLRVSLRGMRDEDRMAAAWTVAQWQSTLHAQVFLGQGAHSVVVTIHADGHCEVRTQADSDFAAWESQHAIPQQPGGQ